jgi:hypothetical protein
MDHNGAVPEPDSKDFEEEIVLDDTELRTLLKGVHQNPIFSLPDFNVFVIFIAVAIVIAVLFILISKLVVNPFHLYDESNQSTSIYLGIIGIPVGVVLAFIVSTEWQNFSDAESKQTEEATQLLLLYNLLGQIPGGAPIQQAVKNYTFHIIHVEFPLMSFGIQSVVGLDMILEIGDMILSLDPQNRRDSVLYSNAIQMYESIISLRIIRLGYATFGLAPEMWWVLILGAVILVLACAFVFTRSPILQLILVSLVSVTLATMLYLIFILDLPYRGDFGIDSMEFRIALSNMVPTAQLPERRNWRSTMASLRRKMGSVSREGSEDGTKSRSGSDEGKYFTNNKGTRYRW